MATENDVIEINSDQEQQPILTNEDGISSIIAFIYNFV